jgi:hypothetical protein
MLVSFFYRSGYEEFNDTFMYSDTMRGQKEEENKNEVEKQQQVLYPNIDKNREIESITELSKRFIININQQLFIAGSLQ